MMGFDNNLIFPSANPPLLSSHIRNVNIHLTSKSCHRYYGKPRSVQAYGFTDNFNSSSSNNAQS